MALADDTLLVIAGPALPRWSARGLTESLEPVDNGRLRRTVNGDLAFVGDAGGRKYAVSVAARDTRAPAFAGQWRGSAVTIDCVSMLSQWAASGTSVTLGRTPVSGSVEAETADGASVTVSGVSGAVATLAANPSGAFVRFRPQLACLVDSFSQDTDEWGAAVGWSLKLVEV